MLAFCLGFGKCQRCIWSSGQLTPCRIEAAVVRSPIGARSIQAVNRCYNPTIPVFTLSMRVQDYISSFRYHGTELWNCDCILPLPFCKSKLINTSRCPSASPVPSLPSEARGICTTPYSHVRDVKTDADVPPLIDHTPP